MTIWAAGLIIAFNVKAPRPVEAAAASQQVPVLSSSVIYKLMDAVTERVAALLPPVIEKRVTGEATVLQLFDIQVKGKRTTQVGGCRVTDGVVEKSKTARVMRNGEIVHEGESYLLAACVAWSALCCGSDRVCNVM